MRLSSCWSLLVLCVFGCGGGGGGGSGSSSSGGSSGSPLPPASYSISGTVTRSVDGSSMAGVVISLSGGATATTTTDASGSYGFSGLANGTYEITPDLPGSPFEPDTQSVVVNSVSITGADFDALSLSLLASGIEFLPATFSTRDQLRVSLVISGDSAFVTDSSEQPLKEISLFKSAVTPLAVKIGLPESVALQGQSVFWVDGDRLNETSLDGTSTTVIATGERNPSQGVTADLIVDNSAVYWVNTISNAGCSPCTWVIQRVPLSGGNVITLATADLPMVALASDDNNIYWEEPSSGPWTVGCQCGSTIKKVAKSGGPVSLIVDGSRNGTLPAPPPGAMPASWLPMGGIAVNASHVFLRPLDILLIESTGSRLLVEPLKLWPWWRVQPVMQQTRSAISVWTQAASTGLTLPRRAWSAYQSGAESSPLWPVAWMFLH